MQDYFRFTNRGKVDFREETSKLNPWVTLVKRYIPDEIEPYVHLLTQDYVAIIALNEDRLALVKQFMVALNMETIELPAGLIESDQTPLQAAINELRQEVGLIPTSEPFVFPVQYVDSARLNTRVYAFFFKETTQENGWIPENGICRIWLNKNEIQAMLEQGTLAMSSHSGMLASLKALVVI
jgi:8-oxo-dGTP pyrophosphatase MutT (NUDIX family)